MPWQRDLWIFLELQLGQVTGSLGMFFSIQVKSISVIGYSSIIEISSKTIVNLRRIRHPAGRVANVANELVELGLHYVDFIGTQQVTQFVFELLTIRLMRWSAA